MREETSGKTPVNTLAWSKKLRKQRRNLSRPLVKTLAPWIIAPLAFLLSRTWRVKLAGDPEGCRHVGPKPKPPCIFALWHEDDLTLGGAYSYCGVALLVSLSNDGDLSARTMSLLGFTCFRGSSSRGGARGLLSLIRFVREGGRACVTVDGPRGPRHVVKPGVAGIARKTGHPVVPIRTYTSRAWSLSKAWSQSRIPKPFATVTVMCNAPVYIGASNAQDGGWAGDVQQVQQGLESLDRMAREAGVPGAV